jgi:hypothetical protein
MALGVASNNPDAIVFAHHHEPNMVSVPPFLAKVYAKTGDGTDYMGYSHDSIVESIRKNINNNTEQIKEIRKTAES